MWNCLGNYYNNIDSLVNSYTTQTPYDYVFLGMRCASSSYDVLQTCLHSQRSSKQKPALQRVHKFY